MREGRLIAAGPLGNVITSQHVSFCFDVAVAVGCSDGRWWSRAISV
jgi:iron complex transport system ATP-binding protein